MKSTLLFIVAFFLSTISYSQIVNYAYDSSGNRISRTISLSKGTSSIIDSSKIVTKISEHINEQTIVVYPNPFGEEVNVDISGYDVSLEGSITLFDQGGRLIISQQQLSISNSLNLSQYSNGIYFMIIKIGTNQTKYTIIKN